MTLLTSAAVRVTELPLNVLLSSASVIVSKTGRPAIFTDTLPSESNPETRIGSDTDPPAATNNAGFVIVSVGAGSDTEAVAALVADAPNPSLSDDVATTRSRRPSFTSVTA